MSPKDFNPDLLNSELLESTPLRLTASVENTAKAPQTGQKSLSYVIAKTRGEKLPGEGGNLLSAAASV